MPAGRDLCFAIGRTRLIDGVTVEVLPGEVLVVIGPNGAGKSTLVRLLAGELRPTAGTIELAGRPVGSWRPRAAARIRAVLPQSSELSFPFTVTEVVLLGRNPHVDGAESARDRAIAAEAMAATEVAHLAARLYPTLSGGERQRVHLARVLAQIWDRPPGVGARYLLLDEPTSSLDLSHQHMAMGAARHLAAAGAAVVAVLHDVNLAAMYADRIAALSQGRLAEIGPPGTVLRPDLIRAVFDVDVLVLRHPQHGGPLVIDAAQAGAMTPDSALSRWSALKR